jgi:hypothetical protein
VRWPLARQVLQSGYDALPKPLHDIVTRVYFGGGGRQFGMQYLPDPQALALYRSIARASNGKAAELLGYRPRYSFEDGMRVTAPYLDWAYGDLRKQVAAAGARSREVKEDAAAGLVDAN